MSILNQRNSLHQVVPATYSNPSQKQYNSISQLQSEEQTSIIEWIKQNFSQQYSHCRQVNTIQDLFDGIALAEIISSFLSDEGKKEDFLNQIEVIERIQTKQHFKKASDNLNAVILTLQEILHKAYQNCNNLNKNNKNQVNIRKMIEVTKKALGSFNGQSLVGSKNKMKNFMMQVVMILPQMQVFLTNKSQPKLQNKQKSKMGSYEKPRSYQSNTKRKGSVQRREKQVTMYAQPGQFMGHNNIEDLSSIMGYSTVQSNERATIHHKHLNRNEGTKVSNCKVQASVNNSHKRQYEDDRYEDYVMQEPQVDFKQVSQSQQLFESKVEKLLSWMQFSFSIDVSQLIQPHILLGELVNRVFAPNRLKDNEKPIKPTHYELGSYAVYKKCLDYLSQVERLNKSNLIQLMKQVEVGKVNQVTFWSLVEDIHCMVKNKISQPLLTRHSKPQRADSTKKTTQQSQKLPTEYDQNMNIQNIKNQSVTQILRSKQTIKPGQLKDAPLYSEEVIKQTQLWLQNQMGMGYPLRKSKPNLNTTIMQNPLLNGTLYAKIIQRLKIGSAKGVTTPLQKKQMKHNLQIVKNQLLNRGYQPARKLNLYKPTYNFYIGLLYEIRQIHYTKENNSRKMIQNDKQKRQLEQAQCEISQREKDQLSQWLKQEFNQTLQGQMNNKIVSMENLKQVIEALLNLNLLKETTTKIKYLNYMKLLDFFRSIGFSHYSAVRVDDFIQESLVPSKKSQNIRWTILRDLKIVKGDK